MGAGPGRSAGRSVGDACHADQGVSEERLDPTGKDAGTGSAQEERSSRSSGSERRRGSVNPCARRAAEFRYGKSRPDDREAARRNGIATREIQGAVRPRAKRFTTFARDLEESSDGQ